MNERDFKIAVEKSDTYKSFPIFKQRLISKRINLAHLNDLYGQAQRLGIEYLKQNKNLSSSDVKLIDELL